MQSLIALSNVIRKCSATSDQDRMFSMELGLNQTSKNLMRLPRWEDTWVPPFVSTVKSWSLWWMLVNNVLSQNTEQDEPESIKILLWYLSSWLRRHCVSQLLSFLVFTSQVGIIYPITTRGLNSLTWYFTLHLLHYHFYLLLKATVRLTSAELNYTQFIMLLL